jgi:hypothetical protein
MLFCMRTTVNLNEDTLRQAKQVAAANGVTLASLIEDAIRAVLNRRDVERDPQITLPIFFGRGLKPGVDLADSAGLIDIMDDDAPR